MIGVPVGSSRHIGDLFARHIVWHELWDWMADEHICMLDIVPEKLPHILLRRSSLGDEITSYLDMRSVQYGSVGGHLLYERYKTRHLRVVNLGASLDTNPRTINSVLNRFVESENSPQ